jgi:hypothetical protein
VLCCALLCLFLLYTSSSHISSSLGQLLLPPTQKKKRETPIQQPQVQKQTLESVRATTTCQHLLLLLFCYPYLCCHCYHQLEINKRYLSAIVSLALRLETPSQPLHSRSRHLVPFPSGQASTKRPAPALPPSTSKRIPSIHYLFFPVASSLDYCLFLLAHHLLFLVFGRV